MNDDYLRDRAHVVRILADKADAFTKGRLLSLAERYDAMIGGPPRRLVPTSPLATPARSVRPLLSGELRPLK
jgi:hypothetical protein